MTISQGDLVWSPKVKTGIETYVYYNLDVGKVKEKLYFGGSKTVESCANQDDCPANSWDATVLRSAIGNQQAFGDFPANSPIFSAFAGTHSPANDGVFADLVCLPDPANDVLLCYERGLSITPGQTSRPVPRKGSPADHYVINRPDQSLSITAAYISNWEGLQRIRGRRVTIIKKVFPEEGGQAQEIQYYSGVLLNVPPGMSASDANSDIEIQGEGNYDFCAVFSKLPPS